jgi:hypothetical protein
MNNDNKERRADLMGVLPARVEAKEDHVVLIVNIPPNSTIGLRFYSPEHLLETFEKLLDAAAEIWPDNEFIRMYVNDNEL